MIYGAAAASITSFLLLAVALAVAPGIMGYDTNKLLSFLENPFGRSSLLSNAGELSALHLDRLGRNTLRLSPKKQVLGCDHGLRASPDLDQPPSDRRIMALQVQLDELYTDPPDHGDNRRGSQEQG